MSTQEHSYASSAREKMLERLLIGALQRHLWRQGHYDLEILHAETDNAGYDILLELGGVMRHIQLKSSFTGAKTSRVNISVDLRNKPAGCVIWLWFDPETLELDHFLFLGSSDQEPLQDLGDRIARHTKGNRRGEKTERPKLRIVNKGSFERLESIEALAEALFGSGVTAR